MCFLFNVEQNTMPLCISNGSKLDQKKMRDEKSVFDKKMSLSTYLEILQKGDQKNPFAQNALNFERLLRVLASCCIVECFRS